MTVIISRMTAVRGDDTTVARFRAKVDWWAINGCRIVMAHGEPKVLLPRARGSSGRIENAVEPPHTVWVAIREAGLQAYAEFAGGEESDVSAEREACALAGI